MPPEIAPFHTISIAQLAYDLSEQGRSVIHMEYGQPSTGAPRAAIEIAHRVLDADAMGYWESPDLKARIAKMYTDQQNAILAPEQVILTNGASPALVLALTCLFAPGDTVALARPGYVAYRNVLKTLHMEPLELDCGEVERFQITAQAIAALDPAPAGVILASPANPTGTIITPEEMVKIAKVCQERNIRIISDEIYHGISYAEPVHSLIKYDPHALIINSFSKYYSMAGWRLGWLIVPPELIEPAHARMGNLFLTPPSLAQHAGLAAMDCDEELQSHVAMYARNRTLMLEALPRMGIHKIAPPDGAFYVYADISHLTNNSLQFCQNLLKETGVATAPGIDFDPVNGHHFIRFSFAVSTAEVKDAIARLERFLA